MTSDNYPLVFALVHLIGCVIALVIGICRLNAMRNTVYLRVRVEYAVYVGMCVVSGLAPLYGEWPGWHSLAFSWGTVVVLICSAKAWKHDKPPESATDHGVLYEGKI